MRRALGIVAGSAAAVSAVSGLAIQTARPAGAGHRLADLVLGLGEFGAFVAVLSAMVVVGEQRRQAAETARRQLYQRLGKGRSSDDRDV